MQPANEFIKGTVHETNFKEFCEKRGIVKDWETVIVGVKWYNSFMKRYSHFIRKQKCKVQAMNRGQYCTKQNFSNKYNCIYKNMVEVGVAVKIDQEIMYDETGAIISHRSIMVGRPTMYVLTNPERVVFVDQTGCNTNCKS